ncbi:MAG: leucine-rich repeat domain-containing protein, partial [Bacteroidaceae bacterium]|nr:leucine-rich repeat domain-containing protein [Bacteroidaceae bacterium]
MDKEIKNQETDQANAIDLSTEVTEQDLAEAWIDEFGVKYSKDGKRLLEGADVEQYHIKEGTEVICDEAFSQCKSLQGIVIPDSVSSIGGRTFDGCESLVSIVIPVGTWMKFAKLLPYHKYWFVEKEEDAWTDEFGVKYSKDRKRLLEGVDIEEYRIKEGTKVICYRAFKCKYTNTNGLKGIRIPLFHHERGCGFQNLRSIVIPDSVTSIDDWTFADCHRLQ